MNLPSKRMNKQIFYGILFLAIMVGCVMFGRQTAKKDTQPVQIEYRTDTLTMRDTIVINKPVVVTKIIRDSIYVRINDTVYVNLPREERVYEDERYRAVVSGYQPSLDRIDIYTQEKIVTKDVTQLVKVKKNARWGVGVQVGYGFCATPTGIHNAPYIGVGLSWNILTF